MNLMKSILFSFAHVTLHICTVSYDKTFKADDMAEQTSFFV